MTIYHSNTWNYDAPTSSIVEAGNLGQLIMQPYIDQGYCSTTEFYWEPGQPTPGGGLFTIRRVWTDLAKLEEWVAIASNVRAENPQVHDVVGIAQAHNDNEYNPPV